MPRPSQPRNFLQVLKDEPGVSGVHVPAAMGSKGRSFKELIEKPKNESELIKQLMKSSNGRSLRPADGSTAHVPFTYEPGFFSSLRSDQVPRFLYSLTHYKNLKVEKFKLDDLIAVQERVSQKKVAGRRLRKLKKLPIVVRSKGRAYLVDGHSRLSAAWLDGARTTKAHVYELGDEPSAAMKRLADSQITFKLKKADPDQQLIFGWASVVTKDGKPIVDHQNDVIPIDELEKAFYDYVLSARQHGHMHSNIGTGRLVECMVFTKQKQDLLGIDLGFEGAWVGYLVENQGVWDAHKRGELPEFSIGGHAVPVVTEITHVAS